MSEPTKERREHQAILDAVQADLGLGGLSDGLYGVYANEVAKRAVRAERAAFLDICRAREAARNEFDIDMIVNLVRQRAAQT